jgi:hypothetical protein
MCFAAHTIGRTALLAAVVGAAEVLGVRDALERQWSRTGPPVAQVAGLIERASPKAWRWAEEMHEIAATFESAGMPGGFHLAAAEIFAKLAPFKGAEPDLAEVLATLVPKT